VATLARYNPGVPDAVLVNLIILLVVLLGPLLFHRIEDNLEAFLFVMGVLSALASGALTVIRQVARTELPSTRAAITWVCCLRLSLFTRSLCLTVHALSRGFRNNVTDEAGPYRGMGHTPRGGSLKIARGVLC